jgi:hypothetical protein
MAKGPEITDEVRILTARLHKEHPKWTNKMIRNEVLGIVHKRDPSLPKDWPSKFSIDRIMPGIRDRLRKSKLEPNPLDRPWTIQTICNAEYHITPEALPSVLHIWFHQWEDQRLLLTIREAQWAARLYAAIKETEKLCDWAISMAENAKQTEDAGIEDYVGSQLDNLFLFSAMTGHRITDGQLGRASGWSEQTWHRVSETMARVRNVLVEGWRPPELGIQFQSDLEEENQKEVKEDETS